MVFTSHKSTFSTNFKPLIVSLHINMQQSISNETYINIFSQLAVLKFELSTQLPNIFVFLGKI